MRTPLLVTTALLCVPLQAQEPLSRRVRTAAPARNAGVLHLATGTWTRKATGASLGADTIYDNTCRAVYYGPLSGDTWVDEGRLPSPSSPANLSSRPGCATSYLIDGFRVGYCTDRSDPGTFIISFFETYTACASTIGRPPDGLGTVSNLPGSPVAGVSACWSVVVDLGAPPGGQNLSFVLAADGNGTFAGGANTNLFGWSIRSSLDPASATATGPLIAGDLSVCLPYDGTRWDSPVDYTEDGHGMTTLDQLRIEGGATTPGCYYYSGGPYASVYLEVYADACAAAPSGSHYCAGDGNATACPCSNASPVGEHAGCRNSLGLGVTLRGDGVPSLASDTLALHAARMPPGTSALFFQGTERTNGGLGTVFGDGLRCASGSVVRQRTIVVSPEGFASIPGPSDPPLSVIGQVTAPGLRTYQVWYRNSASFCTSATFNLSNGWEVVWAL